MIKKYISNNVWVHAGSYAIFYPEDLYRPKGDYKTPGPITKIVVKVRL
ncbi:MAG: YhcH/YjgK/YiaL family protein [Clostridia bacterium]|nr:YhcH/YjgK/YiaL family protein [Clostridia bacterium]